MPVARGGARVVQGFGGSHPGRLARSGWGDPGRGGPGRPAPGGGGRRVIEPEEVLALAARAAGAVKPTHMTMLDLRGISAFTDHFLIVSAATDRQVRAIADRIDEALGEAQVPLRHREGYPQGKWILLDYHQVIIHIFTDLTRQYYDLERLWADAPRRVLAG